MHSKAKNVFRALKKKELNDSLPLVCQSSRLLWWNEEEEYRVGGWGKKSNLKNVKEST